MLPIIATFTRHTKSAKTKTPYFEEGEKRKKEERAKVFRRFRISLFFYKASEDGMDQLNFWRAETNLMEEASKQPSVRGPNRWRPSVRRSLTSFISPGDKQGDEGRKTSTFWLASGGKMSHLWPWQTRDIWLVCVSINWVCSRYFDAYCIRRENEFNHSAYFQVIGMKRKLAKLFFSFFILLFSLLPFPQLPRDKFLEKGKKKFYFFFGEGTRLRKAQNKVRKSCYCLLALENPFSRCCVLFSPFPVV